MSKKITYDFVKDAFERERFVLLSKDYKNSHTKLEYICPNGHRHSISFTKWQMGRRCPYCSGKAKKTIFFINREFGREGYKLLSKIYKNARCKLRYECPNGHIHTVSWDGWRKGDRCPYCSGLIRKNFIEIEASFKNEGYVLLSNVYINAHSKLKCQCSEGHIYEVTWNNWQRGRRCPICEDINFSLKFSGKNSWHWKNYSKEDLIKFSVYKSDVWRLTNINYNKYRLIINPKDLPRKRNKYHLDHIYSIMDGFTNSVKTHIVAHPTNLRMLLYKDNIAKSSNSEITLGNLYLRIKEWEKKYEV